MDSRPIGIFDSGLGGLSIVRALVDLLPDEQLIYLGDTARFPYGEKSGTSCDVSRSRSRPGCSVA